MGKVGQAIETAGLRTGNTLATPLRIVGEWWNALANVLRQWQSSAKNTAEVTKQTVNALVDNFLNFSKVEGKWYQRLTKWTINAVSACTRRPAMIAGAGILSGINQWVRKPFQKLLYTPGKMFKGMWNATRIFSKKKWFDFQSYDTHETGWDTRVNTIKDKKIGFLWATTWSSQKPAEAKPEIEKKEPKKEIEKPEAIKKPEIEKKEPKKEIEKPEAIKKSEIEKKQSDKNPEKLVSKKEIPSWEKPKTLDELKNQHTLESEKKQLEEKKRSLLDWKTMDEKFKKEYTKEYTKIFGGKIDEESVLARGKQNKKWENMEQLLVTLQKENPVMADFIEDEILAKKAPAAQAA